MIKRISVYCGANLGRDPMFLETAQQLGKALFHRKLGLVFGGGCVGLMGAVADAALDAGAEVIGVIPKNLVEREIAHRGLRDLRVVESMHERKALMGQLCDAFIALPGGFGTLDEFCEALTWAQLGLHTKPLGLLNISNYYDRFLSFLDHATTQGFIHPSQRNRLIVAADVGELLDRLADYRSHAATGQVMPDGSLL